MVPGETGVGWSLSRSPSARCLPPLMVIIFLYLIKICLHHSPLLLYSFPNAPLPPPCPLLSARKQCSETGLWETRCPVGSSGISGGSFLRVGPWGALGGIGGSSRRQGRGPSPKCCSRAAHAGQDTPRPCATGKGGPRHWQATNALQDVAPTLPPAAEPEGWLGVGFLWGREPLGKGPNAQSRDQAPQEDHAAAVFSGKSRGGRGGEGMDGGWGCRERSRAGNSVWHLQRLRGRARRSQPG